MKPGAGVWRSGAAYEPYVGRWSRLVANAFLDWLQVPAGRRWLDVGCGTGALTAAILERCDPREVIRIDPSEAYVAPSSRALTTTGSHPSGEGPAPSYAMSLSEERRSALRECIRASLPMASDGSISLTARAWAIRGRLPTG